MTNFSKTSMYNLQVGQNFKGGSLKIYPRYLNFHIMLFVVFVERRHFKVTLNRITTKMSFFDKANLINYQTNHRW